MFAVQDGADSLVTAYQQAVVSAKNVIFNGPLGADANVVTTGGTQVALAAQHVWFCPMLHALDQRAVRSVALLSLFCCVQRMITLNTCTTSGFRHSG